MEVLINNSGNVGKKLSTAYPQVDVVTATFTIFSTLYPQSYPQAFYLNTIVLHIKNGILLSYIDNPSVTCIIAIY